MDKIKMDIHIRPMSSNDIDDLVQLLSAFEPIFSSFAEIMGPQIYPFIYPDWKTRQTDTIEKVWKSEEINAWVAELDGMVIGLVAYVLNDNDKTGQVDFLVVHPEYQNGTILRFRKCTKPGCKWRLWELVAMDLTRQLDDHTRKPDILPCL